MATATNQPQPSPSSNRRTLTGFVTKLVGDDATYGFINDEIFFQQSSVTVGGPARVNDQVYAECEYSAHLPIKWNAISVKVLNKAGAGGPAPTGPQQNISQQQQPPLLPTSTAVTGSDPADGQQSSNVAVTYQQHRQQRLQRQMLEMQQQQQQAPPQQHHKPDMGGANLLQQQHLQQQEQPPEFYAPGMHQQHQEHHQPMSQPMQVPPPTMHHQQQQPEPNLPPFHDRPMGPPKFAFTNQLGSAFVQNPAQFMPSPFLAQQPPPPMLQQSHPPPPPPQAGPGMNNQRQKRDGGGQGGVGGRYGDRGSDRHNNSNQNSNNDSRQNNRRMNNRNEQGGGGGGGGMNKFDRSASDRDNSSSNRSRTNVSRDRSSSSAKKDDTPTRASPPSRSRTSISSDRGSKPHKRHYEPTNIPRSHILTDINSSDMKYRCSSSIHVPSDLRNVIINKYYRLDIKNTPKPIKFNIEQTTSAAKEESASAPSSQSSTNDKKTSEAGSDTDQKTTTSKSDTKQHSSGGADQTKSDIKLNHKYGVKVVLLSLPELEDIYRDVFGSQLDSFTNTDPKQQRCLDETIMLLCSKSSSGGNSLIGGKFDPSIDGFVEGVVNEFERSGGQPDLIATCKRVVREQAGLDLNACQSWTHISTFVYNNKSDYFSPKASIEYSYIYMPQIWTMSPDKLAVKTEVTDNCATPESKKPDPEQQQPQQSTSSEQQAPPEAEATQDTTSSADQVTPMNADNNLALTPDAVAADKAANTDASQSVESTTKDSAGHLVIENLADLKVVELKVELDKRGIKYKPNAKKIELVTALREALASTVSEQAEEAKEAGTATDQASDSVKEQQDQVMGEEQNTGSTDKQPEPTQDSLQLEEGEVLASKEQSPEIGEEAGGEEASKMATDTIEVTSGEKRKISSEEGTNSVDQSKVGDVSDANKKVKLDSPNKVTGKVKLISEPFVVRPQGQQSLALVSLYDVNQVSRYDQFELSVTSSIIKEFMIQHFSEYILTALVEDSRQKLAASQQQQSSIGDTNQQQQGSTAAAATTTTSSHNSQETGDGDTNNNNNNDSKGAFKNLPNTVTGDGGKQSQAPITIVKEFPIDRYINLAFVYFDSTHVGYLHYDDLIKLFNNTGLNLSKRALVSLIGENEKFNYRLLADISPKLIPTYIYKFPSQFNRLPGENRHSDTSGASGSAAVINGNSRVEFEGVTYTVEKLVSQVREAETMRVNYVNRFNQAIENHDKQAEEIHVLEVSQKSLSKAIKAQNEEICELKRERDSINKRYEHLLRGIEGAVSSLKDLVKEEK